MPAEPPRPSERSSDSDSLAGVWITAVGILVAAAIFTVIPELRHALSSAVSGDTEAVRGEIERLGATGVLVVIALGLIHTVVFYPAEILDTVIGFAYGFGLGLILAMGVWMASALLAYAIGNAAARPLLYRLAGRERFERAEKLIANGGATLLLMIRLVPIVPFSLMCMVCGAARVPLGRYIWTTFVGYLPITTVFIYLGSRLDSLSVTDPRLIGSAVVLIALLAITRWLGPKVRRHDAGPA
ncbi:MAG: TVP38/TMEM64 family protein [Solirubrobacterales bacterium]